jgi:glutamine amidotransferase
MLNIGIINTDVGNNISLCNALKKLNFNVIISNEIKILNKSDILFLPGVGSFPAAIKNLKKKNLINFIKNKAKSGTPIIGICLGMQLLTNGSHEIFFNPGLKLIPGIINNKKNYMPHIGWNNIKVIKKNIDIKKNEFFYFNHSFYYEGPKKYVIALSKSRFDKFPVIIRNKKIIGLQFHPEKSQQAGIDFLSKLITNLFHD